MTLQNAYGDPEFPVRARWRWRKVVAKARHQRRSSGAKGFPIGYVLIVILILIVVLSGLSVLTDVGINNFMQDGNLVGKLSAVFLVIGIVAMIISSIATLGDSGLPRREQLRYQHLAQAAPLTERQGQILALDAFSDFGASAWNRSLEYMPVWRVMPPAMLAKHDKTPKFQPFLTFELADVDTLRDHLDQSRSIASTADVERYMERALSEDSISLKFVDLLSNPEAGDAVRRLASLTETTESAIRELGAARDGSPAPLLWATDITNAIAVMRVAYAAEYIDADRTWHHLEQLAAAAFAIYPTWDKYWTNARVGAAYLSNSRGAMQRFDANYRSFLASDWPAAHADFPHNPDGQIADVVRNLRAKSFPQG